MIELSEQQIIAGVADRLTRKYPGFTADTVTAVVRDTHARFDGRPVREYVSLLVERLAGQELELLAMAATRTTLQQAVAV